MECFDATYFFATSPLCSAATLKRPTERCISSDRRTRSPAVDAMLSVIGPCSSIERLMLSTCSAISAPDRAT